MPNPSERSDSSKNEEGGRGGRQQQPPPRQSSRRPPSAEYAEPSLRETSLPVFDVKLAIAATLTAFAPHNWRRNPRDDYTEADFMAAFGWDPAWDPPMSPAKQTNQRDSMPTEAIELAEIPRLDLSKIPRTFHLLVASELFDRHPLYLIQNISEFHEEDLPKTAELFLRRTPQGITTCGHLLAANLHLFKGLNHELTFNRLLEASSEDAKAAISNFDQFKGIEPTAAALRALVIAGCADCLADNIEKFPGIDRTNIASKLQEPRIGAFTALARNAQKFPSLNHSDLLTRFLQSHPRGSEIAAFTRHAHKLTHIDYAGFAEFLTTACPDALADNIDLFPGVDKKSVARKLMSRKIEAFSALARNASSFPDLDQKKLVERFFKSAPAEDQLRVFFAQLSCLDRLDPCWLIKTVIRFDFESLSHLNRYFESSSAQFNRQKLLAVLITETEKHIHKLGADRNKTSSDSWCSDGRSLRLLAADVISCLIRATPAELRLDLVDAVLTYDDIYVSSLAECLTCFEDSDLANIVRHLIEAGHESRSALVHNHYIFDFDYRAAIMRSILETDPTDGPLLILDSVKYLTEKGQTLVLRTLAELDQFEYINMLTWEIPIHDIDIVRGLLTNFPDSDLAKSIGLHKIESVSDEKLARAARRVLAERRREYKVAKEDDEPQGDNRWAMLYQKIPSIMHSLRKKRVRAEILGTSEVNRPTPLPVKSRAEWAKTLHKDSHVAPELASNLARIVPQKSDTSLFAPLAAAGYPNEVLSILDRYPDIRPKELKKIHFAIAKGYIVAGYFEMANRCIDDWGISDAAFAKYLEVSAWKDFVANNFYPLFAVGAWVRCQPNTDLSSHGLLASEIYKPFVSPFIANKQPTRSYGSPNEIFIRVGLPLLHERDFLRYLNVELLSATISLFLQHKASTAAAWESHKANLAYWELKVAFLGELDLLPRKQEDLIREELASILSFYLDYPRLLAPGLRYVIRLLSSLALPLKSVGTDDVTKRVVAFLQDSPVYGVATHPGMAHIRQAFEALSDPSIDSDKRERDRAFLTGNLDPSSVNTYCGTLLYELLTAQQYVPLGYFDLELLNGLTRVRDLDVIKERYAHLYIDCVDGKVPPLHSNIAGSSFDFTADRLSREAAQMFAFSDPSRALYQTTRATLLNLRQFDHLSALAARKRGIISALQEAADAINLKASSLPRVQTEKLLYRSNLIKAAIKSVAEAQSMSELLFALCRHSDSDKQLKGHIRDVALAVACNSTELKGHEIDALSSQEPSRESIERMYEILQEKVLHNSTLVEAIGDDMPAVRAALGVATFEEELRKLGKMGTRGVESIRAYATRGLLGELAGFIGESCLTRQEHLMRRHPNATAIIFVKNADKPESIRLEGSCMLLTVKDNDGNDVLVIRGLNPTQNLILSLSAASFFEQFLEHVAKPIAKKLHIKKIAIPTPQKDIFFEARTNRPSLAVYLTDRCANLPSITFENDRDRAVFNDNSFEKSCVVLWSDLE